MAVRPIRSRRSTLRLWHPHRNVLRLMHSQGSALACDHAILAPNPPPLALATSPLNWPHVQPFPKGNNETSAPLQADKVSRVPDRLKFSLLINKEKPWRSG